MTVNDRMAKFNRWRRPNRHSRRWSLQSILSYLCDVKRHLIPSHHPFRNNMSKFFGFQLINDEEEFCLLKDEWNQLWSRSSHAAMFQSFSYCYHSWLKIVKGSQRNLCCMVRQDNGRVILIWPLVRYRRMFWTIVRPLGPRAAEYTHPLVEDSEQADQSIALAWQFILKSARPDIVNLPFVKVESRLHKVISSFSTRGVDEDVAPYVSWKNEASWDEYYQSLSGSYRKVQNKKRRQLSAIGAVTFDVIEDKSRFAGLIRWLLAEKRKWCNRTNKKWIFSKHYEDFLSSLATDPDCVQPFVVYVLNLDGRTIAAQLAAIGNDHVDWVIAGFDSEFARSSPGILLNEHCLHWAFDRKLDCDFGAGAEENKLFWSKGNVCKTATTLVVTSFWGKLAFKAWRAQILAAKKFQCYRQNVVARKTRG